MKSKQIIDSPRTFVLVFDTGDEVSAGLLEFAKSHSIEGASFTALGAFEKCTLGYFEWMKKEYRKISIDQQSELLSLVGNVAHGDSGPKIHAHAVIGLRDGETRGGHLVSATVRPTLEVTLVEAQSPLIRKFDRETGLPLIQL